MACPYFYPIDKASDGRQPARAPLGVMYTGRCEAGGAAEHEACNFGYARHSCAAFPEEADTDAVRFTTIGGAAVFILEKDYVPVRHGSIDMLEGALARQAEVFREWSTQQAPHN
jgi:hypothetical protein